MKQTATYEDFIDQMGRMVANEHIPDKIIVHPTAWEAAIAYRDSDWYKLEALKESWMKEFNGIRPWYPKQWADLLFEKENEETNTSTV